jgi:hypothetical protein
MPKRSRTPPRAASASAKPQGRQPRPGIIHTSLYLPQAVYEGLREGVVNSLLADSADLVSRASSRDRCSRPVTYSRPG